ncbi:MAG: hypothetical protein JW889_00855 [Verrucomicrobia bacterium]|nr:hypothetical protein [Verrucomicrobiota bacterium]
MFRLAAPCDIGWIKVNDGNDTPTEIKVCRPFDDGTTGVDLVLSMPKGAETIRLWKDAEKTQPIAFNDATFADGGNRFTSDDSPAETEVLLSITEQAEMS